MLLPPSLRTDALLMLHDSSLGVPLGLNDRGEEFFKNSSYFSPLHSTLISIQPTKIHFHQQSLLTTMSGKILVPFIKLGTTSNLDGEITPMNAIILIGDLSMEEDRAVDVQSLAILPSYREARAREAPNPQFGRPRPARPHPPTRLHAHPHLGRCRNGRRAR